MGGWFGVLFNRLGSVVFATLALLIVPGGVTPAWSSFGDCGQPVSTGAGPVATDALIVLNAAVGAVQCDLCVCDVDNNGVINATDALGDLKVAVGQPVVLACPVCASNSCFSSQAPSCGGDCDPGETCAEDPEFPGECECFNACEIGPAPTCGGSCEATQPGTTCTSIQSQPAGQLPIELCACIPPGLTFCDQATGPACDGVCSPGTACESDGGSGCICAQLPVQPACGQASAPDCFGSCSDNTICEFNGVDACTCVAFTGQPESCFDAAEPVCGGVCAFGEVCSTDIESCGCLDLCEISGAPACGGPCDFQGDVCTHTTITLGADSLELCECRPGESIACAQSGAPTCGGDCPPGDTCGEDPGALGTCVCTPASLACFESQAPSCGGTCAVGETCVQTFGGFTECGCQPDGQVGCFESQAPSCGGNCPVGTTCSVDPEFSFRCECLDPCQLGPAPTCGGNCDGVDPGSACRSILVEPTGASPVDICECLPPALTFCSIATGPACDGFCGSGALCESDGGSGCICTALPVQPTCAQAQSPDCFGSCSQGTICEFDGVGACVCAAFTGQPETCYDAQGPSCGGVCGSGQLCAGDSFGDCECVSPCELGAAPACGGSCAFAGDVCTLTTFTVDGNSIDLCECREQQP